MELGLSKSDGNNDHPTVAPICSGPLQASSSNQSPEGSSAAVSAPTSALERFLATEFGEGGVLVTWVQIVSHVISQYKG